jgi:serine/threonine protein kinase/outer membrane protein assembly factor BamB
VTDELLGQQIGSYQLVQILGQGAFGSVYLGKHFLLEHKPLVAVKVLNTTLNSQEEIDRFFQEAMILDRLSHPGILPVIDANLYDDLPFFIAEYAAGGSLRDIMDKLDGQPMSLLDVLHVIGQVGPALQHAHDLDIVHRDLKPANILFNADGDALLADFGIALEVHKTRRVDEIGTPPYMAPEQFKGQVSKKSDQYALACIVYEMLTGELLFTAEDPYAIGYKHIYEAPINPRDLNPDVPPAVEDAILKALAKDRDDRFESVAAFVQALQMAANVPLTAPDATVVPPLVEHIQTQLTKTNSIELDMPAPVPEKKLPLPHRSLVTPRHTPMHTPYVGQGYATQLVPVWNVPTGMDHTYYSEPMASHGIVYAGTYTTAEGVTDNRSQVHALDMTTGALLWSSDVAYGIFDVPAVVEGLVYVSAGEINVHGRVYALDAATGQQRWSFTTDEYLKAVPMVTGGVVYAHSDHAVYALDAATGQKYWSVALKATIFARPTIANDVIYIATELGNCYALNAATGEKLTKFTDVGELYSAVTTDSGVVCIGTINGDLYALDVLTGQMRWTVHVDKHISGAPTIANGVIYIGAHGGFLGDSANTKLYAIDIDTGMQLWSVGINHEIESSPVIVDDQAYVSTFGRELYVIDIFHGRLLCSTMVGHGRINRPAVSNNMVFISTDELHAFQLV